jgi:hypothetical protein
VYSNKKILCAPKLLFWKFSPNAFLIFRAWHTHKLWVKHQIDWEYFKYACRGTIQEYQLSNTPFCVMVLFHIMWLSNGASRMNLRTHFYVPTSYLACKSNCTVIASLWLQNFCGGAYNATTPREPGSADTVVEYVTIETKEDLLQPASNLANSLTTFYSYKGFWYVCALSGCLVERGSGSSILAFSTVFSTVFFWCIDSCRANVGAPLHQQWAYWPAHLLFHPRLFLTRFARDSAHSPSS